MTKQELFKKNHICCNDCGDTAIVACPECGEVYCENCVDIFILMCENCENNDYCIDCEKREKNKDYDQLACYDCYERIYG